MNNTRLEEISVWVQSTSENAKGEKKKKKTDLKSNVMESKGLFTELNKWLTLNCESKIRGYLARKSEIRGFRVPLFE